MNERAEYIIPKVCERCNSENIVTRVIYDKGITKYVCLDCGYDRALPKEANLKKRTNTTINHWALQTIKHQPYCRICGSKENLCAHHIIPVSHSRKYMYCETNGITLCQKCHYLVHNKESDNLSREYV